MLNKCCGLCGTSGIISKDKFNFTPLCFHVTLHEVLNRAKQKCIVSNIPTWNQMSPMFFALFVRYTISVTILPFMCSRQQGFAARISLRLLNSATLSWWLWLSLGLADLMGVKFCGCESAVGSIPSYYLDCSQLRLHTKHDPILTLTQANPN